jgi:hypothetical protein
MGSDGESVGWSRPGKTRSRKVGTPQGRVLANGQSRRLEGQCNRKQTADGPEGHRQGCNGAVRAHQRPGRPGRLCKPHPEQGQAWDGRPGQCPQVDRSDGWPPVRPRKRTTESRLQTGSPSLFVDQHLHKCTICWPHGSPTRCSSPPGQGRGRWSTSNCPSFTSRSFPNSPRRCSVTLGGCRGQRPRLWPPLTRFDWDRVNRLSQ